MRTSLFDLLICRKSIAVAVFFICSCVCLADLQQDLSSLNVPKPPSPQASAFMRVGEYKVNNSSGVPDISIPLFELDHYGYKIPFTLRYEASPIKPGYNYDVHGFCWALSGHSCVTRTLYSHPDEFRDFKLDTDKSIFSAHMQFVDISDLSGYNFRHDRFSAVLPDGTSFDFILYNESHYSGTGSLHVNVSNGRKVKVTVTKDGNGTTGISGFDIIDESGIHYIFREAEQAVIIGSYRPKYQSSYNSTWHLTQIDFPNGEPSIYYTYGPTIDANYCFCNDEPTLNIVHFFTTGTSPSSRPEHKTESLSFSFRGHPNSFYDFGYGQATSICTYKSKLLKQITCGATRVSFSYDNDSETPKYNRIKKIDVFDEDTLVRTFAMEFDQTTIRGYGKGQGDDLISLLKKLQISGETPSETLTYQMEYSDFYSYNAYGTDHWGYYNRWGDPKNIIADFNVYVDSIGGHSFFSAESPYHYLSQGNFRCPYYRIALKKKDIQGASRQASSANEHHVLTQIKYPNGGYTDFYFENHKFLTATGKDGDYEVERKNYSIAEGGGFRIKSIQNYTADNKLKDRYDYRYGYTYKDIRQKYLDFPDDSSHSNNDHTGYGEPVVDPNIRTYTTFRTSGFCPGKVGYMMLGMNNDRVRKNFVQNPFEIWNAQGSPWAWEMSISPMNFRNLLGGRRAVVYPEITVYHGDAEAFMSNPGKNTNVIGKTVYRYNIYKKSENPYTHKEELQYFENLQYDEGPYGNVLGCNEFKNQRDNLTSSTTYDYKQVYTDEYFRNTAEDTIISSFNASSLSGYIFVGKQLLDFPKRDSWSISLETDDIPVGSLYSSVYDFLDRKHVTYESHTNTFNSGTQSTSKSYSYNSRGQVSSITYQDVVSNRDTYTYPGFDGTNPDVEKAMAERNIISPILSRTTQTEKNGMYSSSPELLSGSKIEYAEYSYNNKMRYLPSVLSKLIPDANGGTYEPQEKILSYSAYGRPMEVINLKTKVHTVYLWGYRERYLIAEIRNATFDEVKSVFTSQNKTLEDFTKGKAPNREMLNLLHEKLPEASVTTWTYRPYAGVLSCMEPNGVCTYYDYDGLGRLKEIYRYKNNIIDEGNRISLEKHEYNTTTK